MRSMTGYGKGSAQHNDARVGIEISSVNRKQQDIRIVLPRELSMLESRLRGITQNAIARGYVSVYVTYEIGPEYRLSQQRLDEPLAQEMGRKLRQIAVAAGLGDQVCMSDILMIPGVILEAQAQVPLEELGDLAEKALVEALGELDKMREEEAQALATDLVGRCNTITAAVADIRANRDAALEQHRDRLLERVRQLGVEIETDDERLLKEVVFFAERSDVTEEIIRLDSHIAQMLELLRSDSDVGRQLDFLCQEMSREINTLSAKTSDTTIADYALTCKIELGRIREQIMNIE